MIYRRVVEGPAAIPEKYRRRRRLLGRDCAPLTPHREPAIQCYQDLHHHSGVAGTIRSRQQLDSMQLEPYCIVLGHLSAVLEAQDLFQAQLRIQWEECSLRVLRRCLEALIEPGQELHQHVVGLFNGACPGQPESRGQPVLKGSRRPLYPPLGLGRQGEYQLDPQLLHRPAELG